MQINRKLIEADHKFSFVLEMFDVSFETVWLGTGITVECSKPFSVHRLVDCLFRSSCSIEEEARRMDYVNITIF